MMHTKIGDVVTIRTIKSEKILLLGVFWTKSLYFWTKSRFFGQKKVKKVSFFGPKITHSESQNIDFALQETSYFFEKKHVFLTQNVSIFSYQIITGFVIMMEVAFDKTVF